MGKKHQQFFPVFEEAGYAIARGLDDFKIKAAQAGKMILIQKDGVSPSSLPYAIDRKEGGYDIGTNYGKCHLFLDQGPG